MWIFQSPEVQSFRHRGICTEISLELDSRNLEWVLVPSGITQR